MLDATCQRITTPDFQALSGALPGTDCAAGPLWLLWLNGLAALVRGFAAQRQRGSAESHEPIFRIAQISEDCWAVERPGASLEHAFPDLEAAVAFVRKEITTPAVVELRIGDLYVVARFDPRQPTSLFGEAVGS
jgi:hypothetical protein